MDETQIAAFIVVALWWMIAATAILRWGPGKATRWVRCPNEKVRVRVQVQQGEGDFGSLRVLDVAACTLLPGPVTCGKECLAHL